MEYYNDVGYKYNLKRQIPCEVLDSKSYIVLQDNATEILQNLEYLLNQQIVVFDAVPQGSPLKSANLKQANRYYQKKRRTNRMGKIVVGLIRGLADRSTAVSLQSSVESVVRHLFKFAHLITLLNYSFKHIRNSNSPNVIHSQDRIPNILNIQKLLSYTVNSKNTKRHFLKGKIDFYI